MLLRKHTAAARQGFTLVELLVVIAITAVLFALLLIPLIQAVRLTQRAQIVAAAQDSARKTTEQIAREAGSAVYVFDNASHPFTLAAGKTFAPGDDKFTNFLNLEVPKSAASGGGTTVAHAYNAKLDLVPARRVGEGTGAATDPTTGGNEPVTLTPSTTGGSASLGSNGALFPLAPGSTIVRYFIGLKRPIIYNGATPTVGLYANSNEKLTAAGNDNTYVLYRAQVQPYTQTGGTRTPNSTYFAVTGGNVELDDPDFFRFVTQTDVDWLSPTHAPYGAAAAAHNDRVKAWTQIAKPVITAPAIDLLIIPHNPDGTVAFDTSGTFNGVAHQGVTTDPVPTTPVQYPVVKTSVTFAPATLTADAAPSSTTGYTEQGVPTDAADNNGLPYVPTVYTSADKSWGYPYNLSMYALDTGGTYRYTTDLQSVSSPSAAVYKTYAGDLIEYYHPGGGAGVAVYDITQGLVLLKGATDYSHNYVPLIVNPDTGTINFAVPALPAPNNANSTVTGGYNLYTRFWSADAASVDTGTLLATQDAANNPTPGIVDLTKLYADTSGSGLLVTTGGYNASPLSQLGLVGSGPLSCANAFVVPGSLRVYGPDATPGPSLGTSVLYSPASPGALLGFNQYRVDYLNNTLTFYVTSTEQLPTTRADGSPADPIKFAFDYQANLSPSDTTKAINNDPPPATPNPARPYAVKLDYQTRDLMDINIGVRVYDPTDGHPLTVPESTRVQIGNPNR